MLNYLTKLAGLKRPIKPKVVVFTTQQTSATKNDYTDEISAAQMLRGNGSTYGYAIPRDAINADIRTNGSPFIRLLGDEFCTAAESLIWLGATKNLLVGGGPLTENNGPTYVQETSDDESPLYEQTVGNLASSSSQYWSLPTGAAVQFGTNSFMIGIAFKTTTTGQTMRLAGYGDYSGGKAAWSLTLLSSNKLQFDVQDTSGNNPSIQDPIAGRWQDGLWHIATVLIDRTSTTGYLFVDGQLVATGSVSSLSGTLTQASSNFYIGAASISGTVGGYFNGNLALCKIINNAADYNVPQVWNMGIQEAVSSGTFTTPTTDSNKRLNNKFGTPNTNNAYFYATVLSEDGEYELQIEYEKGAANGKLDLIMDGITVRGGLDTYNSSTTHNNTDITRRIKLSAGRHLVKIYNNGSNGSSSGNTVNLQWINFIKRRGHENGGLNNALLFGEEINERSNFTISFNNNPATYYNIDTTGGTSNLNYTEGTIFAKGGYYRIDYFYYGFSGRGLHDLWFGDTQVLSLLDESTPTGQQVVTKYVRLQQGKQNIRLAINGAGSSGSGFNMDLVAIRLERVSD